MSETQERRSELTSGRVPGYDVARSLALMGMFVVHFGLVLSKDHAQPAWAVTILNLFDGRAAATFVILAGVGLSLRATRARSVDDPLALMKAGRIVVRRGLVLLAVGFVNLVIWPGDILRVYGVSLLVAAWFLDASPRRLITMAMAFVFGFMVLLATLDYGKNWEWQTMTYHHLWTLDGVVRNLFYDGFRSIFPWTGLLFYGMWLGQLDLRNRAINTRVAMIALGILLSTEVASRLLMAYFRAHPGNMDAETIQALFGTVSMPPLPMFLLSVGSTATLVIAVCVRLMETYPNNFALKALAATGQMAFTWYVVHIVLGLGGVVAADLETTQPLPIAEGAGVLFFASAVVISWAWKRRFRHGPLEWALRKVAG